MFEPANHTESTDHYLKAIYYLQGHLPEVRKVDLASYMDYSKPSISHAVKMLEQKGYIVVDAAPPRCLRLTEAGRMRSEQILKRYGFWYHFLRAHGIRDEVAKREACAMEHVVSDETMNRIRHFYETHGLLKSADAADVADASDAVNAANGADGTDAEPNTFSTESEKAWAEPKTAEEEVQEPLQA